MIQLAIITLIGYGIGGGVGALVAFFGVLILMVLADK